MTKRHYGLPTQGGGIGSDAKAPDFQDGIEVRGAPRRASGRRLPRRTGHFDGAQMTSLATIVLHHDAAGLLKETSARTSFDAGSCLLDDIRAVGPGGHYIGRRSTRGHARDVWEPTVLRRGTFEASRGRTLVQDALERARDLLATHEVLPLPDDVDRHLDEVIATHRRLAAGTV